MQPQPDGSTPARIRAPVRCASDPACAPLRLVLDLRPRRAKPPRRPRASPPAPELAPLPPPAVAELPTPTPTEAPTPPAVEPAPIVETTAA
jgi:hypothetical protein